MIDKYYQEISKNMDIIRPVFSYQDIENNMKNGFMSSMLTIEEGGVTQGNLAFLRNLYLLGVRMITLTWNFENGIGFPNFKEVEEGKPDMHTPNTEDGLTEYGIEMVKEMEKLGIIIDVSHLSDKGFYDVLENTTKPFVASHSNARTVCPMSRNLSDDMIRRLAERGGVMGLNFYPPFLGDEGSLDSVICHAKHIVNVGGIDVLGLGSDFDGIDGNEELPGVQAMPRLIDAFRKAGFTLSEIEKIFCENVLRIYREVIG
jgi:membrane dipeptidase